MLFKDPLLPTVLFFALAMPALLPAQNPVLARSLVEEGVALHDKGKFKEAVKKYDKALEADKDNLLAMVEKALSLNGMGEYEQSAALCQQVIAKHDGAREAPIVYVTYGNSMDQLGRPEASLRVYDEGIKALPDLAMLHFNKGITLSGLDSIGAAMICFERAARLDPFHPGTQNAIGRTLVQQERSIPATLALCRFLVLEPEGKRATECHALLQHTMTGHVEKTPGGGTKITMDASMLRDSTDTAYIANDFRDQEMIWSLTNSLDIAAALAEQGVKVDVGSAASVFKGKLDALAGLLQEGRAKGHGFLWDYHAAWFLAVHAAGHTETLAHLAYASSDDKDVMSWIKANGERIGEYYAWEKDYSVRVLKQKP